MRVLPVTGPADGASELMLSLLWMKKLETL
jgi:hypothetical protein